MPERDKELPFPPPTAEPGRTGQMRDGHRATRSARISFTGLRHAAHRSISENAQIVQHRPFALIARNLSETLATNYISRLISDKPLNI